MTVVVAVAEEKDWRFGIFFFLVVDWWGWWWWWWLWKKIGDLVFFFY